MKISLLPVLLLLGTTLLINLPGPACAQDLPVLPMRPGQLIIKTNPLLYSRPEFHGFIEVGLKESLSLEFRAGHYPGYYNPFVVTIFTPTTLAPTTILHLMLRHYLKQEPTFFISYGLMFKKWEYDGFFEHGYDYSLGRFVCHIEDRKAIIPGLRVLYGMRWSWLRGSAVFEWYTGFSYKLRFESGMHHYRFDCPGMPFPSESFEEIKHSVGIMAGINLGIVLNNR